MTVAPAAGFVAPAADQRADAGAEKLDAPDGHGQTASESDEGDHFSVDADVVGDCGDRCRTVTANLTNTGNETAENVTTVTRMYAGDTQIWERTDDVGTLESNESTERTVDVSVDYLDSYRILSNDGEVTIRTTVYWDGGNETFIEHRSVN